MKSERKPYGFRYLLLLILSVAPLMAESSAKIMESKKIWDAAGHNAFTDLIHWHGQWWCTFRESIHHVGGDGKIRVLVSADGNQWASAALLEEAGIDLRDPKFSVTPQHQLMIVCGGAVYHGTTRLLGRQSRVLFSDDGRTWSPPLPVLGSGDWLWRVTWHDGVAYGAAYNSLPAANLIAATADPAKRPTEWDLNLCVSRDGRKWEVHSRMDVPGDPNETTVRFLPDGTLIAMVRRETGDKKGWIGTSRAPYQQWTWQKSNYQFGGPNFIVLPDGRLIAGTRDQTKGHDHAKTLIAQLDAQGQLHPLATLPSGGDNSYPGLVWEHGTLWVSYYSSHEAKTSIYLAKLKL